jgi:hypothetical protein
MACHSGAPPAAAPTPIPSGTFAQYLARAEAEDTTLDFQAFRLSYATTEMYDPYGQRDEERQDSLFAALDRDSLSTARLWADSLLADNPVTPEGQAAAAHVARLMNDSTQREYHRWMAIHLMASIRQSASGTATSPFVVIAVYEEYALARYLGLGPAGTQGLGQCGSRACDIVTFKPPGAARDTTLYFDVSIPMAYLDRTLKH